MKVSHTLCYERINNNIARYRGVCDPDVYTLSTSTHVNKEVLLLIVLLLLLLSVRRCRCDGFIGL